MLQLKVTNQLTEAAELKKENFGMEMDVVTMKREQVGHTKGWPVEVVCLGRIAVAAVVVVVAETVAAVKTVRKVMMEHGKTGEVVWMLREVARAHLL
jgi:antitoxin component of RelBE/YafQ-DinJ toxin-antitoxin module